VSRRWRLVLLAACVGSTCLACSRFKTTDQLRAELHATGDSTWLRFPCQELVVDAFGWPRDSLEGVAYRVHPGLIRRAITQPRFRFYESRTHRQQLQIQMEAATTQIYRYTDRLNQLRVQECSIRDRVASVAAGRRDFRVETTVIWHDIGDGRSMRVTLSARSVEEAQLLRATLFTMEFPGEPGGDPRSGHAAVAPAPTPR
jgi:hypothetical protein